MREEVKIKLLKNLLEEVTKKYDYFIAQRESILEDVYKKSITDELTGLYNRYYVIHRLREEIIRALREDRNITIIMFDLDNFKPINDKYGHLKGDEVLKKIGDILKNNFRPYDIVARLGGDEFIALFLGDHNIEERLEKIKKEIESLMPEENLSVSYGFIRFPIDMKEISEDINVLEKKILAKVDSLMYENKRRKKGMSLWKTKKL